MVSAAERAVGTADADAAAPSVAADRAYENAARVCDAKAQQWRLSHAAVLFEEAAAEIRAFIAKPSRR